MKSRLILAAVVAAALAVPAVAGASGYFKGPIDPGNQAEVIELRVEYDGNRPRKIAKMRWANVPTACSGGPSATSGILDGKVRVQQGQFDAVKPVRNSNATVHITGSFKKQNKLIVGTFRQTGSSGGCPDGDTGELGYRAKKGSPET
jgi:hypothetical protein